MPFIIVFTVSSTVQFIPKAVRATKPLIAIIAIQLYSQYRQSGNQVTDVKKKMNKSSHRSRNTFREDIHQSSGPCNSFYTALFHHKM